MNMKRIITLVAVCVGALSSQAATKVIYLSGATAFRGVEYSTIQANMPGAEVVGLGTDNQFSFSGTWTGPGGPYALKVYASYSGSLEGQDALLNGTPAVFKHLPIADG